MLSIKEFNKKIGSLKNTRKMTKTMKMVSASKFKRAYKAQSNAMIYARKLQDLMGRLSAGASDAYHPFFKRKKTVKNILIILVTSDKGLCGGFNNYLIRYARTWFNEHRTTIPNISFSFCGRKGHNVLRRHITNKKFYENITIRPSFEDAIALSNDVTRAFLTAEFDEVYLAFNKFNSAMSQTPIIEKLLPLDPASIGKQDKKENTQSTNYEYEPTAEKLIGVLVNKYINFKIFYTLLENAAGEHGARMSAMDKASQNTSELIDKYTLLRNRARQASITTELIEIISGAEALK